MKEKVLELLAEAEMLPQEKYNEAMRLFRQSRGHSVPAANYYNRAGYSPNNLKNICYDLKKLHNINDAQVREAKLKGIKVSLDEGLPEGLVTAIKAADDDFKTAIILGVKHHKALIAIGDGNSELAERLGAATKKFMEENAELLKVVEEMDGEKQQQLFVEAIGDFELPQDVLDMLPQGEPADVKVQNFIGQLTEEAGKGLKLREEFPFLNEDDCPEKFHTLVGKMISAWNQYKERHAELNKVTREGSEVSLTDAELYTMAKEAVDKFEVNRTIWDELEYYKEHGQILGHHPIFKEDVLKNKVDALSDVKAVARQKTLRTYVSRDSKNLANAQDGESKAKIAEKLQNWNDELALIDKKLEGKQ